MQIEMGETLPVQVFEGGPVVPSQKVYMTFACGKRQCVAQVLEPDSSNPGLHLLQPLGFNGVRSILEYIQGKQGIEINFSSN